MSTCDLSSSGLVVGRVSPRRVRLAEERLLSAYAARRAAFPAHEEARLDEERLAEEIARRRADDEREVTRIVDQLERHTPTVAQPQLEDMIDTEPTTTETTHQWPDDAATDASHAAAAAAASSASSSVRAPSRSGRDTPHPNGAAAAAAAAASPSAGEPATAASSSSSPATTDATHASHTARYPCAEPDAEESYAAEISMASRERDFLYDAGEEDENRNENNEDDDDDDDDGDGDDRSEEEDDDEDDDRFEDAHEYHGGGDEDDVSDSSDGEFVDGPPSEEEAAFSDEAMHAFEWEIPEDDADPAELLAFAEFVRRADEQGAAAGMDSAPHMLALGAASPGDDGVDIVSPDEIARRLADARRIAAELRQALEETRRARQRRRQLQAERAGYEAAASRDRDDVPIGIRFVVSDEFHDATPHTAVSSVRFRVPPSETRGLVTAEEVLRGRDLQGIPWDHLGIRRADYRLQRQAMYPPQVELPHDAPPIDCTRTTTADEPIFRFHQSTQALLPCYYHQQLRHLLHAPSSSHEVIAMCADDQVRHVNLRAGQEECVMSVNDELMLAADAESDPAVAAIPPRPPLKSTLLCDFAPMRLTLCSLGVRPPLLFLGEQRGDLLVRNYATGRNVGSIRVTSASNAIVNAITFMHSPLEEEVLPDGTLLPQSGTGAARLLVSNNDSVARIYDLETIGCGGGGGDSTPLREFRQEVPVNYAIAAPDGKQVAIVGDARDAWLRETDTGRLITSLCGHQHDIFSASFHPTRPLLATGAQDNTCRVYDLRRPDKTLYCLAANLAPVRSVQFARGGEFLVMAEGDLTRADFVHVVDFTACAESPIVQTIDVFGEISGVALSPDDSSLFIGVTDRAYGCLVEYQRPTRHTIIDFFE